MAFSPLNRTVLVADDEPLIRMLIADTFNERGFEVLEASSAGEAISLLAQRDCQIDLVVTDVRMPGEMDGFALASWARRNCGEAKIVIITGYAGENPPKQNDFDAYVRKPFDSIQLLATAERLLVR